MIVRRTRLLLAVALSTLGAAHAARADDGQQAVAIVAGRRGALAARLSEELRAAGLQIRVEALASDLSTDGFVIVIGDGDDPAIEVLSKRGNVTERVALVEAGGAADARVLRVTEIVRALALPGGGSAEPTNEGPSPDAGSIDPPAASAPGPAGSAAPRASLAPTAGRPPPLPPPPPLRADHAPAIFEAGVFAGLGVAAQGPSMSVDATVRFWPHERVGVGLLASLPVVGAQIGAAEGQATMRTFLFGAELDLAPVVRTESLGVVLSPGIGLAHVTFSAEAAEGYRARDDGVFAGLAYGRVEGRLRVTESFRLAAAALGGGAFPPVEVRFAGRPISTYAFAGGVSLGLLLEL
ncbi:MAG: hypothetical protein JNL21_31940 [Myxococcales bacterium]|nr:hypothetical protein [Myxococcales bacterium]